MLRRTKEGVRAELSVPPREEMTRKYQTLARALALECSADFFVSPSTVYVPLSPAQRFWYKRLLTRADTVTLGEIFNADFKNPSGGGRGRKPKAVKTEAEILEEEGEAGVREHIEKAMAASKAGDGNAWMKMMNL